MSDSKTFRDKNGDMKHLRKRGGKLVHTGDSNYILIAEGVVHHPVAKIFKATMHRIR